MLEDGKISRLQLGLLVINFTVGSALLIIPSAIVSQTKQDGWSTMLLSTVIGGIFAYLMITLANHFPNLTIIEILQTLLGKYIGSLLGLIYAWFFLHLSALVIANSVDFVNIAFMPETPKIVFSFMAAILILSATFKGIEVIGRSNEIFSVIAASGVWLTIFLLTPTMKFEKVTPLFPHGFKPILRGLYPVIGFPFAEVVVFLMILPFVNKRKKLNKYFIGGTIIAGLSLFAVVLTSILVLNVRPTEMSIYPTFNMARLIKIGDFLTRVEALISLSFVMTIFIKMVLSFYASVLAFAQIFKLNDYRPLIIPLLILAVTLSLTLNHNIVEEIEVATTVYTPYSVLLGVIIPSILLVIAYIKKKKHLL